jgi:succinylglutamate desuccinylase
MAGIHGNEATGVEAAGRVVEWLETARPPLAGEVVFLAGNLPALARHVRFIDLDLNRQWTPEKVANVLNTAAGEDEPREYAEQREILAAIGDVVEAARGPLFFLDMHTSSAEGPPFVTIGDTLRNRRFAQSFPLPLILGLEEQVDGALLELLNNRGFVTMGVEGGYHEADQSRDCLEAVLRLALVNSGVLRVEDSPGLAPHRALLREASRGIPRVVEVRHRHAISGTDGFRMEPGYFNFKPVRRGQQLGRDDNGPVFSPRDGMILLPLYQGQGDDGYFVSRGVAPLWLQISRTVRRLRLFGLMRLLPGVRATKRDPEVLIVNTRIARLYPLDVFHLFGFRKVRQNGTYLIVSRRRYDLDPPQQISSC